jgi:hypothetical protein
MARRQTAALVALALLGGLGLGFATTAASGARRADSAYNRLRVESLAPDALFDVTDLSDQDVARLARLRGVLSIARFSYTPVAPSPLMPGVDAGAFVGLDPDFLFSVYRPIVLSGRLPDPTAGDEVVVNEALARIGHLEAGQRVELVSGFDQPAPIGEATVVGIVRGIFDVGANSGNPTVLLSERFLEQHRDGVQLGPQPAGLVRLVGGERDLPAFRRDAGEIVGRDVVPGFSGDDEATGPNRTLRVQTVGLGILALVAGIVTLGAVAQALSRLLDRALADLPMLVAIGVRPRQRLTLGALLALPVALGGGVVAMGLAFVASPLIPTGFARTVDPVRGHHLDVTIVAGALCVWALMLVGAGVGLAWRHGHSTGRDLGRRRRSIRALPLRVRLGCEAALAPVSGAGGIAARSALVAAVVGVGGVVSVATFGASLAHLLDAPELQGWSFDAAIVNGDEDVDSMRQALAALPEDRAISEVGWATLVDIDIGGRAVEAYAFDPGSERLHPTVGSGRPPSADDEIVLGRDFDASLGDRVVVSGPAGQESLVVVGSATYPELGNNSDLGGSASLARATASRLGAVEHGSAALIRLRAGHVPAELDAYSDVGEVVTPFRSPRVRNLEELGELPWLLALFASAVGLLAVGHGLWASARARRRERAVLASIGFCPGDLRAMLLWQALCIAGIGAIVGVAAGVVGGTDAWSVVADATAVVDHKVVPWLLVALIVGGACVAFTLMALAEAHRTREARISDVLRGE